MSFLGGLAGGLLSPITSLTGGLLSDAAGSGGSLFGSGAQTPSIPDYMQLAQYQTNANRVNQYSPYGNITYDQSPGGQWNMTTSLNPVQQSTLNNTQNLKYGFSSGALGGLPQPDY